MTALLAMIQKQTHFENVLVIALPQVILTYI